MEQTDTMTYREFINSFMAYQIEIPVETKLANYLGFREDSPMMERLKWLGIFENRPIGVPGLTPAKVLQQILEKKWQPGEGDKDMILMQHQFDFNLKGVHWKRFATMVYIPKEPTTTAMSDTVGLPLAMIARRILDGSYTRYGVQLPIHPDIFDPVLEELESYGIRFVEEEFRIPRKNPDRTAHNRT
jgi:saccharopine dehydrogenase-like NADP-dependent oxidoreductase